jgi:D-amino-acid dehydrogenase
MENKRVVVIGGGITGITTAFMIKRNSPGAHVVLLEKRNELATVCSFQNGGIINFSVCHPWTHYKFILGGLRGLWDSSNLVQFNTRTLFNPEFWLFTLRFIFSSFGQYEKRHHAMLRLGERSYSLHHTIRKELMQEYADEIGSYGMNDPGMIDVYSDTHSFQEARKEAQMLNEHFNQSFEVINTREKCAKFEPAFGKLTREIAGCRINPSEPVAAHDPHLLVQVFAKICKDMGVVVLKESQVTEFYKEGKEVKRCKLADGKVLEADIFVICAGMESKDLSKKLGWNIPLWAAKGYSVNADMSMEFKHTLCFHDSPFFYISKLPRGYRLAYFVEFTSKDDYYMDPKKVEIMEKIFRDKIGGEISFREHWVCHRPVSSDDLPIIGKLPNYENVYLNTGHGSRGSILAFGSAELVSHLIMNKKAMVPSEEYSPSRFYF